MEKNHVLTFFYNSIRGNQYVELYLYDLLSSTVGNGREKLDLLSVLYRLIGYTRDIVHGKGEYTLAFGQLYTWYLFYPDLCFAALQHFFYGDIDILTNKETHPWGSWKDVKYLCQYVYEKSGNVYHPIILSVISLLICQIKRDMVAERPSLAAKWAPREGKKFGWVNTIIVQMFYPEITKSGKESAYRKAKMLFRKTISTINRKLNTVQINMCNKNWDAIEMKNVTSLTMQRNYSTFEKRVPAKMESFINDVKGGTSSINGGRCNLYGLVKAALHSKSEIVNIQWKEYTKNIKRMNYIPVINVSSIMENNSPYDTYVSIGLGLIVSEKNNSKFKNRLMIFAGTATWLNLEGLTFRERVHKVWSKIGGFENVYRPFEKIVEALVNLNYSQEDVCKLNILLVSSRVEYSKIQDIFKKAHYNNIPKIAFWNLWEISGMPCDGSNENVVFLSGYDPRALNILSNNGRKKYKKTPWWQLKKLVDNKRYDCLDFYIRKKFS